MLRPASWFRLARAVADPNFLRIRPSITRFLLRYMGKFRAQEAGGHLVVHSHLPPLGSRAFARFVKLHLVKRVAGPTHAQIGVTPVCGQRCGYCYNRGRSGVPLDVKTLKQSIIDLQALGVVWLGFTGGEPLLCPELDELVALAARECAVKVFTTGDGLTVERARALGRAGCFSVAISLDDWREADHDAGRGLPGAYQTALAGIRAALEAGNLQVSVSSVVSLPAIRQGRVGELLDFLRRLGVHEAWLSEPKPAAPSSWTTENEFREEDRQQLIALQDEANRVGGMTVNYLGHFEAPEHFGCNAGSRMLYIDAWGEVCPCVFAPLSFGNVREHPLAEIYRDMCRRFPPRRTCFVHDSHRLFAKYSQGAVPLPRAQSARVASESGTPMPSEFMRLLPLRKETP